MVSLQIKPLVASIYGILEVGEDELSLATVLEHIQMVYARLQAENLISDQVVNLAKLTLNTSAYAESRVFTNVFAGLDVANILTIRDAFGQVMQAVNAVNLPQMSAEGRQGFAFYFDAETGEEVLEFAFAPTESIQIWYEPKMDSSINVGLAGNVGVKETFRYFLVSEVALNLLPFIRFIRDAGAEGENRRQRMMPMLANQVNKWSELWLQDLNRSRATKFTKGRFSAGGL